MSYRPGASSTVIPSRLSNASAGEMQRSSQGGAGDVWYLEPLVHDGTRYLVDRATGQVYKDSPGDFPQLAGRLNSQGRVELRHKNTASESCSTKQAHAAMPPKCCVKQTAPRQ